MRALAVDPGGTTGMSVWECSPETAENPGGEFFKSWATEGQIFAVNEAWGEMHQQPLGAMVDVVICESFTITSGTAKKTRGGSNTALEIIGALRWLAAAVEITFVLQAPADAKGFATDDKLKRLGWYTPGADHARDSARHMLLYLSRAGCIDAARLLP